MILNWKSTSYTAEQATSDNTAVAALHSNNISLSAKKHNIEIQKGSFNIS